MHYTILSLNCHRISSGEFLGLGLSTLVHQGHHLLESNQSLVSQSPVKPYSNPNPESNPSCSSPSPVKSSSNPNPDSNTFRSSPKPVKPCSTPISDALSSEVSEMYIRIKYKVSYPETLLSLLSRPPNIKTNLFY